MFDRSKEFIELTKRTSPFLACEVSVGPGASDTETEQVQDILAKLDRVMDRVKRIEKYTKRTEVLHKTALAQAQTEESLRLIGEIEVVVGAVFREAEEVRLLLESLKKHKNGREGAKIRSVGRRFVEASGAFEGVQEEYRQKYQRQLERQYKLICPEGTELFKLTDSQTSLILSQQIFKLPDESDARHQLEALKDRRCEMYQLEKGVDEVRRLFSEIAVVVEEQGDHIDKLEDYVVEVSMNAEKTSVLLDQTVEMHKKKQARRRRAFMFAFVILGLLIGIIANELGLFSVIYWIFQCIFK